MVKVNATHTCMSVRGARIPGVTESSAVRGIFKDNSSLKAETLELLK